MENNTKFTTLEILEGMTGVFPIGLAKNKDGKTIYARQVKGTDGKPDKKKTKVMVKLCLPARKDNESEESKFISACVSLENAGLFKEAGIDLGVKGSNPIRVRYSIVDYSTKNEDGTFTAHTLREIVNVGTWDKDTSSVKWVKTKPATPEAAEPEVQEVSDEDLPF